jgi:hypothetical protein
VTAQAVLDIHISVQGRSITTGGHPNLAEVYRPTKTVHNYTLCTEAVEICTGFARMYRVNHILEINGFLRLAIRPDTGDRPPVYVCGVGIVTDDTELGAIVAIGAVQAQEPVALVALCNIHDRSPVLGGGVSDREALDHSGHRHAQVVGAAWN